MDQYRQYLNEEKIPWDKAFWILVIFCTLIFLSVILSGIGISMLISSSWFVGKISAWFLLCFLFGGFFVILVKFVEQWDESLIDGQNAIYFTAKQHSRMFLELVDDSESFWQGDYNNFFIFLHHAFKSQNHSKENDLNMGKKPLSICFDFVAMNGKVRIIATISSSKIYSFNEAVNRFFPNIEIIPTIDPTKYLKENIENGQYDINNISGFALGLNQSNLYPPGPIDGVDHHQDPIQNMLNFMKNSTINQPEKTIILQYGFVFGDTGIQKKYNAEFDQYLKEITDTYNPVVKGDDENVADFFPQKEILKYNATYKRLHNIWFMTAMRVLCYDPNSEINQTEKRVENMFKGFFDQSKLPLEIVFLTSTRQTYYKYTDKNRQLEPDEIYDNMYYPKPNLEVFLAPLYEKYYYPQESLLRKGTMLRSICSRNPMSPWHPKYTQLDPQVIKNYFYLGKV